MNDVKDAKTENDLDKAIDYGPEPDELDEPRGVSEPQRLKLAKWILICLLAIYVFVSALYVISDIKGASDYRESAKEIWSHFSQLASNAFMLVIGYYFAKGK